MSNKASQVRNRRAKILYIHHASGAGGASVSLMYLLRSLDLRKYDPVVALIRPSKEVRLMYEKIGIGVLDWTGISTFEHTTARNYNALNPLDWYSILKEIVLGPKSVRRTRELVRYVDPDVVHLNSVVLLWSAFALRTEGIPCLWHVREHPVHGLFGLRLWLFRRGMKRWVSEVAFLTEGERKFWIDNQTGIVLQNAVDFQQFNYRIPRKVARHTLEIPNEVPVLLYVGGMLKIKGILVLLEALGLVAREIPDFRCIMPGMQLSISGSKFLAMLKESIKRILKFVGMPTISQRYDRLLNSQHLRDKCISLSFSSEMPQFYAACDALLFPALEPHFARPIVEAGAMKRPVIASDIQIVRDQIEDGLTGFLVPPGDPEALANAVVRLMKSSTSRKKMGEKGFRRAKQFHSLEDQKYRVDAIYSRLLAQRSSELSSASRKGVHR